MLGAQLTEPCSMRTRPAAHPPRLFCTGLLARCRAQVAVPELRRDLQRSRRVSGRWRAAFGAVAHECDCA
eukprot:scaffold2029_cov73-Phaeocystis_antarctica.AAC.3